MKKKNPSIFDIDFESTILPLFDEFILFTKYKDFLFSVLLIFGQKTWKFHNRTDNNIYELEYLTTFLFVTPFLASNFIINMYHVPVINFGAKKEHQFAQNLNLDDEARVRSTATKVIV